ncbi:hypothetical protein TNCT_267301 [Trichonephila clavata]|uniref:Uncharacterized protein n=1 Tax=Trichonephila clavata TaxID=2740835 RepID=A0A8X6LQE2_TRICU|nr:hypothetical protein TNCT_267301 [Trichonephila clavata]
MNTMQGENIPKGSKFFEDSDKMRLFVSGGVSSSEGWNPKVSMEEFQNKPNTLEISLESLENSTRVS